MDGICICSSTMEYFPNIHSFKITQYNRCRKIGNSLGYVFKEVILDEDGPTLPSKGSEEFRPFMRRLPEFKFW